MTQEVKLKRVQCSYQAEDARFLLECDFSKQYSQYYRKRLEKTKPFLEFTCRSKWDSAIPLYGLAELASLVCDDDEDEDPFDDELDSFDVEDPAIASQLPQIELKPQEQSDGGGTPNFSNPKRMRHDSIESDEFATTQRRTSTQNAEMKSPTISIGYPLTPTESPIIANPRVNLIVANTKTNHKDCIVIGTIFKRMNLQTDIIGGLTKGDFNVKIEQYLGHYTSREHCLVLEDADESISLTGNINPQIYVTGVVVALLGRAIDEGSSFTVKDICFAEPNRQLLYEYSNEGDNNFTSSVRNDPGPSIDIALSNKQPIYLMVVSGLGFHQDMKKRSLLTRALQDMIDFIWGGSKFAEDNRSSRVARILVAGDSLLESRLIPDEEYSSQNGDVAIKMKQSRQVKPYTGSIQAVKHMDDFFAQLSKTINVDVMPGPSDPSSHLMPQQPFHPCMFPKSCMFPTFNCITNPHHAIHNDKVEVFATSGQNIDIVSRFSALTDPIEIMKCHLLWGNCAPNAPDNLYSCPYEDEDPYVIDFIPDLYIAGCQEHYRTDYYCYSSNRQELSDLSIEFDDNDELVEGEFITEAEPIASNQVVVLMDQNQAPVAAIPPNRYKNPLKGSKKSCTLLVTVPKFCETLSCVLINLLNLESNLVSFK